MSKEAMLTAEVAVLTEMVRVLSAKVEQQEQGEPIGTAGELFTNSALERLDLRPSTKIYTTPQQRTWVGLTNDEFDAIYEQHHNQYAECISVNFGYERDIEAKLREKNSL